MKINDNEETEKKIKTLSLYTAARIVGLAERGA